MASSKEWENLLNGLGDKPTYTSKYQSNIDSILDKISNREQFSYDFNADPLYQQYKDQYTKLGDEASMNAAANVSALSGGYGNSYAATAASQANQQYLTQLNNVIPELANAALNKYKMETEDLYNQYSIYGNAEDRNYGQYRDQVADYYTNRDYYTNGYNNALNYEYQQNRDAVSDAQWREQFDTSNDQWNKNYEQNKYQYESNMQYQKDRDAVADAQWREQFDTSKDQWNKNYELSKWSAQQSAANSAASLAFQKEKYAQEQADKAAKEAKENEDANMFAASEQDFSRYMNFATEHGMSQDQAYEYINRLWDNHSISDEQAKKLAKAAGLSLR